MVPKIASIRLPRRRSSACYGKRTLEPTMETIENLLKRIRRDPEFGFNLKFLAVFN